MDVCETVGVLPAARGCNADLSRLTQGYSKPAAAVAGLPGTGGRHPGPSASIVFDAQTDVTDRTPGQGR